MIQHGVLWLWDFGSRCYFIGFIMYVEEGVYQGSGVVWGRVWEMLIFEWVYEHDGANT